MNLIDISKEKQILLNQHLGQGKPNASLVFFDSDPETPHYPIKNIIDFLILTSPKYKCGDGFTIDEAYSHPTTSDSARFISRLTLAIKHKDSRWVNNLSNLGNISINKHIFESNNNKDICLINLRPLPYHTRDTWVYSNINIKEYNKTWNFTLKRQVIDELKTNRISYFKSFFEYSLGLIIGVGDKENKKKVLEQIYPKIKFEEIDLITHKVYFSKDHAVILSDHFNNRNGIKLEGLRHLYNFIIDNKLA